MNEQKISNYVPLVCGLARDNRQRLRPGTVHEMRVSHDSWCLVFKNGPCSCNPEVELIEIPSRSDVEGPTFQATGIASGGRER
jgi:hypothetical protein